MGTFPIYVVVVCMRISSLGIHQFMVTYFYHGMVIKKIFVFENMRLNTILCGVSSVTTNLSSITIQLFCTLKIYENL